MSGNQPPQGMDPAVWNQILQVIQASVRAMPAASGPTGPPGPPGPAGADGINGTGGNPAPAIKSAEEIGYFDPTHEDANNSSIVNAGRHVFYRDPYVFVDRLKDLARGSVGEQRIRELVPGCLRGGSLIWYSTELTDIEKDLYRDASLYTWCRALIQRFKERGPVALQAMQAERYTMTDARNGRTPRAYVQDIIRHAKAAEFSSTYNQLTMAWNNLKLEFRAHIPEPKLNTTLPMFLESLDEKANIWQQMAAKRVNLSGANPGNSRNNRQISKQNSRQGRQDSYLSDGRYAAPSPRWTSYQFQNSQYQNAASLPELPVSPARRRLRPAAAACPSCIAGNQAATSAKTRKRVRFEEPATLSTSAKRRRAKFW
jgi:hypothetical protein